MSLIEIPGTTLVRDTQSTALINKDQNGLQEYIKKRNLMAAQKEEINTLRFEVQNIRNDMSEIKKLMLQLIDKSK